MSLRQQKKMPFYQMNLCSISNPCDRLEDTGGFQRNDKDSIYDDSVPEHGTDDVTMKVTVMTTHNSANPSSQGGVIRSACAEVGLALTDPRGKSL